MTITIIPRAEWEAREPNRPPRLIQTPTPELWLHHTAFNKHGYAAIRAIQAGHMDGRGWNDIAYSFLVDPNPHTGTVDIYEGRGAGISGAHTFKHNSISHGIGVIGNYQTDEPIAEVTDTLAALIAHGHQQGWWPNQLTGGHRDALVPNDDGKLEPINTACPGDNLHRLIPEINAAVAAILNPPDPLRTALLITTDALAAVHDALTDYLEATQ